MAKPELTDEEKLEEIRDKFRGGPRRKLKDFAQQIGVDYDELIFRTFDYLDNEESWNEGERFDGVSLPDGYWDWFELVTGRVVPADQRDYSIFSCAC